MSSCCSDSNCDKEDNKVDVEPMVVGDNGLIDVSFDKNGGVMKKILKHAQEDALSPPSGSSVTAHYVGQLLHILLHFLSLQSSNTNDYIYPYRYIE